MGIFNRSKSHIGKLLPSNISCSNIRGRVGGGQGGCAVSKYQGRCEQRNEVFVRGGGGQVGGGDVQGGSQGGCEQRIEVFVKIQKGGGSGWWGGQGGCERNVGGRG